MALSVRESRSMANAKCSTSEWRAQRHEPMEIPSKARGVALKAALLPGTSTAASRDAERTTGCQAPKRSDQAKTLENAELTLS